MADWWEDSGGGFDFGGDNWGGSGGLGSFDTGSISPMDYNLPAFNPMSDPGGLGGWSGYSPTANTPAPAYYTPGSLGAPGAAAPSLGQQAQQAWSGPGGIGTLQGLLGLGGGLAGLIGQLAGGGIQQTQQPVMGTAQKAAVNQAGQALTPFAGGTSPLQQMQMSLLGALASGQGLPPGYAQLIEQAFQPQLGDLATRAVEAGRARGFHDAPGTSPPGGAILGPGLANLQGQMAAAKLGLMQSLPGLYNTPISQQIGAAGNQANALLGGAQLGTGQQATKPMGPMIGNTAGGILSGAGQAISMQGQDPFIRALQEAQQRGMGITISGQPRYT